jgi:hypothetical protein
MTDAERGLCEHSYQNEMLEYEESLKPAVEDQAAPTLQDLMQELRECVATERAVSMGAIEGLYSRVKVLSEEKRLAEEAREQAILEKDRAMAGERHATDAADEAREKARWSDCERQDAASAMRGAERNKGQVDSMGKHSGDQSQQELAEAHTGVQDGSENGEQIDVFYKDRTERPEKELAAVKEAQQDAREQQEGAEASFDTTIDQIQTDLVAALETRHELEKELAERVLKDDICRLETELLESNKAMQATAVELDKAITRDRQALAENALLERSNIAKNTVEADLRTREQCKVELARGLERHRASYAEKLSECAAARDLALEQKNVAILQGLSLEKDLALERDRVAKFEKALEAKDRVIADSEDRENDMTKRLGEEIMAKESFEDGEHVLATQLGQILVDTSREISDLREHLVREQSAVISFWKEKDMFAKQLAREVAANKELTQRNQELESELQNAKKELSATRKASKEEKDLRASLENEMVAELASRKQTIHTLEEATRILLEQVESQWEAQKHLQRSCGAGKTALGLAEQAKMQLEKDLQSQITRHEEEINQARQATEQARNAKEDACKEMESMKQNLEGKLSEQATVVLGLQLECEKMELELAGKVQSRQELETESVRQHNRLSARLQEALVSKEQAAEEFASSRGHLQATYQKELEARAQLEHRCHVLSDQVTESAKTLAKREEEMGEREALLVRRLQATDLAFRDQMTKCERAEEELRVWKGEHGVIALD